MTDNNSNYEEYLIKNQQNKLYYQKHKERINEYARKYYDNNRNKLKQYHKIINLFSQKSRDSQIIIIHKNLI